MQCIHQTNRTIIPYQHNISHTVPHHTPYRTTYHTIPILYLQHLRGSTVRGHEKSMPTPPKGLNHTRTREDHARYHRSRTILLNRGAQPYEHCSAAACAAGEHIYITDNQSKSPTQPSAIRFSVHRINLQPPPCNSSNAGGVVRTVVRPRRLNKRAVTRPACQVSGTAEFTRWIATA